MIRSTARLPLILVALALGTTVVLGGCGSGAVSTVASSAAQQAKDVLSTATGSRTAVSTTTAPGRTVTQTATRTAETKTTTKTAAAQPGATASIAKSATVNVHATQTTPATSDSGGLPWWAWVLITLAVVGVVMAIFAAGRRRGKSPTDRPPGPPGPPPPGAPPPPAPPAPQS
jgi:cobalamin biosynthesis Mg chelatase CobN